MANVNRTPTPASFSSPRLLYPSLNGGYTIWGHIYVDLPSAITGVQRDRSDKPLTPVHMLHVNVERVGPVPANAPEAMSARPVSSGTPSKNTAPGNSK
jgi:hypothetical protein